MGVPKFFRWLTERYPQINRRISEGRSAQDYVDNFYLDMNGIIHTCTHGDGINPGENLSEDQMVERIFEYTERLINIAKPRKLCYLAIDGVAPRAKMNQQRSRRYRAPREAAQLAAQQAKQGIRSSGPTFDSNCITPGTDFLARLGERYKSWIKEKMASDPSWRAGPTIVFSGADVVGEGEHKIMAAIREVHGRAYCACAWARALCMCMGARIVHVRATARSSESWMGTCLCTDSARSPLAVGMRTRKHACTCIRCSGARLGCIRGGHAALHVRPGRRSDHAWARRSRPQVLPAA